jgi:hypothetical protein
MSDYDTMRLTYGTARGKRCGDCVYAKKAKVVYFQGDLHCKPPGQRIAHVTGDSFPACGRFKAAWQAERELLEKMGQMRIPFIAEGGALPRSGSKIKSLSEGREDG